MMTGGYGWAGVAVSVASVFVEAESIRQTDRTSPRSTAVFPSVTLTVAHLSLLASSASALFQAKYTTRRAPEVSTRMARCWDALTLRCVSRHRLQSGFSSSHCTAEREKIGWSLMHPNARPVRTLTFFVLHVKQPVLLRVNFPRLRCAGSGSKAPEVAGRLVVCRGSTSRPRCTP